MSKLLKLRRVVLLSETGAEAPSPTRVIQPRLQTFDRFPHQPGREARNTPYEMTLDMSSGLVTIEHPDSHQRLLLDRVNCAMVPFTAEDDAKELAEMETKTTPAASQAKAATA